MLQYGEVMELVAASARNYVSANHLAYVLSSCSNGMGGVMLRLASEHENDVVRICFGLAFHCHRACDVGSHIGNFYNDSRRLDHLLCGLLHLCKYLGISLGHTDALIHRYGDLVDCMAHSATGLTRHGASGMAAMVLSSQFFYKSLLWLSTPATERSRSKGFIFVVAAIASALLARHLTRVRQETLGDLPVPEDLPDNSVISLVAIVNDRCSVQKSVPLTPTEHQQPLKTSGSLKKINCNEPWFYAGSGSGASRRVLHRSM